VCNVAFVVCNAGFVVCDARFVVCNVAFVVCDAGFVVCDAGFVVCDTGFVVCNAALIIAANASGGCAAQCPRPGAGLAFHSVAMSARPMREKTAIDGPQPPHP
jgi:hypothetical protein